jgi:hypothetical protein
MLLHFALRRRRGHAAAWLTALAAGRIRGLDRLRRPQVQAM